MRFAISIPQFVGATGVDAAALKAHLLRAEELGFDGAWVLEQVIGSTPLLAPMETLAYAAACTRRMRLGCAVVVSSLHSPIHLAASITTVDHLSNGRVDVGVSPGGGFRMFSAFGVDRESFVARFTEGLRLMQAAWTEPTVTFRGRFWQVDGAPIQPKPVQRPHPPIWFGANHPRALRRAVRLGDGFLGAGSSTTAGFIEQVGVVRRELQEQGRDPATFAIGKRVYLAVADDAAVARRQVADGLLRVYAESRIPHLAEVAVAGTPDDVVAGLREVAAAGAELIVLNPLAGDAEQMERLAAEVIPHLS
ncbi:MAG: LLM class flavin-dependent oxidoreductase [Mycobacteriales bacterium]